MATIRGGRARALIGLGCSVLLAAILSGLPSAHAADDQGRYSVRGVGGLRCSEVARRFDERAPDVPVLMAWADGVLTAVNRSDRETYDIVPFNAPRGMFAAMVLTLCRQFPNILFDTAIRQMVDTLKPARLRREEESVTVTVGDKTVAIRPQTIRLVQERLKQLNMLPGTPDGRWNTATQTGLKRFQESRKIPLTEIPDPQTVFRLLLEK